MSHFFQVKLTRSTPITLLFSTNKVCVLCACFVCLIIIALYELPGNIKLQCV